MPKMIKELELQFFWNRNRHSPTHHPICRFSCGHVVQPEVYGSRHVRRVHGAVTAVIALGQEVDEEKVEGEVAAFIVVHGFLD